MVNYTRCQASNPGFGDAMDEETGIFVAPVAGSYEVSFSGLLEAHKGNRVWATLYKLDADANGTLI